MYFKSDTGRTEKHGLRFHCFLSSNEYSDTFNTASPFTECTKGEQRYMIRILWTGDVNANEISQEWQFNMATSV